MNTSHTLTPYGAHARRTAPSQRRSALRAMPLLGMCTATAILATACGGSSDDGAADQAALDKYAYMRSFYKIGRAHV